MKSPETPPNEHRRLQMLSSLNLLDTQPEERFDRITRIAQRLFHVPIALVSLIDDNRQWFKSSMGLNQRETPRDISFCGHAILQDDIMLVPDATQDHRFSDNPLVVHEPKIQFYAGCPIKAWNGYKLGTLCIIDHKPRQFSQVDLDLLKDLAAIVEHEISAVELATVDELTALLNRRGFMLLAQQSLKFCNRQKIPASLLFLDLDKFKLINDRYGHSEGDRALIAFANLMRDSFRKSDVLGRLGGDEFVVFMAKTPAEQSSGILARFTEAVEHYNAVTQRGYEISFSYGIVENILEQQHTLESLIASCDSLMYEDKHGKT